MSRVLWANFFHMYQPPDWNRRVVKRVIRECYRPFFRLLKRQPSIRLTLNLCGSVTEQMESLDAGDVVADIRQLLERKQIEVTATVKYHPLVPLLPETEIERQIALNDDCHRSAFGSAYSPRGFYLPEMCYSERTGRMLANLGYAWTILDEISLTGTLGAVDFERGYRLNKTPLKLIFRNRTISDLFFMDALKSPDVFLTVVQRDPRVHDRLITGVDIENLGHHNPRLLKTWFALARSRRFRLLTLSELLRTYRRWESAHPVASNWASRESELLHGHPYYLWKNKQNSIHRLQWKLTELTIRAVKSSSQPYAQQTGARQLLDKALASDQYWWASASPWWSVELVSAAARKYLAVLALLNCPKATCRQAQRLYTGIVTEARRWQRSGLARNIRQAYLNTEAFTRVFGGKTVT